MNGQIEFFQESSVTMSLDEDDAKQIMASVLKDLDCQKFSINVITLEDEALRKMKNEYFHEDVYTDVISFTIENEPLEGELYISPERIEQNAEKFGQSPKREFARILIHGACHLCGYDDVTEEEKENMTKLEDRFLTQYFDK